MRQRKLSKRKREKLVSIERARENPLKRQLVKQRVVISMVTGLGNRTDENSENFNKETETIEKHQSEMKNVITEMKNTLAGIKSRLCDTEE